MAAAALSLLTLATGILTTPSDAGPGGRLEPASGSVARTDPPAAPIPPTTPGPAKTSAPFSAAAEPGTSELLILLAPGTDAAEYARQEGLTLRYTLFSDPNAHVFAASDGAGAGRALGRARAHARVRRAYLNERLRRVKCAFVPDDPYFGNQWHLGGGAITFHANVIPAWNRDVTGQGVLLGIVDDGLQTTHPDLAPNYVAADSRDFGQGDSNPDPVANADNHGTAVAGVAAARGGNTTGVTGAAPRAGLAGLRIDFQNQTTAMFVDATKYHSTVAGGNTSIKLKNHSYGYDVTYVLAQAEWDAAKESAEAGTVHAYAAGNERGQAAEDSNKQHLQSSPHVLAVAALGSDGKFASYSSFGANVFVTTPSSSSSGLRITTTDRTGNNGYNKNGPGDGDSFSDTSYTTTFGGTSSATPLAIGVLALVKQVQPNLNIRFAKHLLARTSRVIDANDSTLQGDGDGATAGSAWRLNAAGFRFNQNYGFGLIDADALTQQALLYTGVTTLETASAGATVNAALPDNNAVGVTRTFSLTANTPLEEFLVTLDVTHTFRGDVEAFLTSPAGTTSRLCFRTNSDSGNDIDWTFVSNAFWGETPSGTWTLRVRDVLAQDTGTWNAFSVEARMGQLIPNVTPPAVSSIALAGSTPTNAATVAYTVTFTKSVTGVTADDFVLSPGGLLTGATVSDVSGSGSVYTVTASTGTGDGSLRLDVVDDDTIQDSGGTPLGGAGAGNGNYAAGPSYSVDKTAPGVLRVTSTTPDGAYRAGQAINVTVEFTEPVLLAGGDLLVTLDTGDVVSILPFGPAASAAGTYMVGSGDNSSDLDAANPLTLSGGTLQDAAGNASGLSIPVGQGLAALKNLVIDTQAPGIARVTSATPNATYGAGSPIDITVEFSEPVTLPSGTLQVTLSTGDVVSIGAFGPAASASGTYTVGTGDNALDLDSSSPLVLSGGTLQDAAGNNATLTVPAGQNLAALKDIAVDTAPPTLTVNQAGAQADPTNGSPILFTVQFSEPVTGFSDPADVSLAGTAGATSAVIVPVTGATYTVQVSGMAGNGTVILSVAAGVAADGVGNGNLASTSTDNTVTYDTQGPAVTIDRSGSQPDPTNGSPIRFTVVFSEPVSDFDDATDVTLGGTAGPTTAVIVPVDARTYTVEVSGMTSDGTVTASVGSGRAIDAAGNGNAASTSTDNSVQYDATAPTVTINQALSQSDPANSSPVRFTVVFSEPVSDFDDAGDVSVGGTAGATTAVIVPIDARTYTVEVSGMTSSGTVTASIPAGAAVDGVGNLSSASTSGDNEVTYDVVVPTVTINQEGTQADPTNVGPIAFTVVFSESVTGFQPDDVLFTGSTAGGPLSATVTGSGATYTVEVSGMSSSGTVQASIRAGAAVGASAVPSAASTSTDNVVIYDVTGPTVTVNQAGTQADPTRTAPVAFTVLFNEAVTDFQPDDISFAGSTAGGALAASVSGSGTLYTVTVTGMASTGDVVVSIPAGRVADGLGNLNSASTSTDNTVLFDVTQPTVTIDQAATQPDPTNGSSVAFTVVFSEPVTGFSETGVILGGTAGPTAASVSGGVTTYTVTVSGMSSGGTVTASVSAGAAADAAGNPSLASTSTDNVVTRDVTAPTVTVNQAAGQADPTGGSPVAFTVVFDEPVSGFGASDVSFAGSTVGGTLAAAVVAVNATTFTVNVTGMAGEGLVVASVVASAAVDAAGNPSAASTGADNSVRYDGVAPTVTVNQAAGQADPAPGPSIAFTVVFDEPVTGFDASDVVVGGTAGGTASVSGSGPTYTVTVSGMTGDGTVIVTVRAAAAVDAGGNASQASTSGDNTVTFDGTAPTVTVDQAAAQADPTRLSPITFTVAFSEPVSGFSETGVVVSGTAGGTASVSGSGADYTVTVTGMSGDGKVVVTVPAGGAIDAAGNGNEASTSGDNSVTYDTTGPGVVGVNSTKPDGMYGPGAVLPVTVEFSEAVTVVGVPRLTLETGGVDATVNYASGSGSALLTFIYTVSGNDQSLDLDYVSTTALGAAGATLRDAAGNDADLTLPAPGSPGSLAANRALVIDTSAPLPGAVDDGWSGPDVDVQTSVTTVSAHWGGFADPHSGIASYEWAIGTSPGAQNVRPFAPVGLRTAASTSAVNAILSLSPGTTYFVTVRATNGVGLTATASSNGVTVSGSDTTAPAAPAWFVAVPTDGGVLLEWAPDPSGDVSGFRVWWKAASDPWTAATLIDSLAGTSTTITGLANGVSYDVMLKAVDAAGNESAGLFDSFTPRPLITIGGSGSYATVQEAVDDAGSGQTVELGPATFFENVVLAPGVSLCGVSARHTVLRGPGTGDVVSVLGAFGTSATSRICDLRIEGGTVGVRAGTADVRLQRVVVHHMGSHGVTSEAQARLELINCTLATNGGDGVRALGSALLRNCISGQNGGLGLNVLPGVTITYTNAYDNVGGDFVAGTAGTGTFSSPALFTDEAAFDYTETPFSPTVDAGHPADDFSQEPPPDGGRINLGAFGNTPWAASKAPDPGPAPAPSGGSGGGGGCGSIGLDGLLPLGIVMLLRRLASRRRAA